MSATAHIAISFKKFITFFERKRREFIHRTLLKFIGKSEISLYAHIGKVINNNSES